MIVVENCKKWKIYFWAAGRAPLKKPDWPISLRKSAENDSAALEFCGRTAGQNP